MRQIGDIARAADCDWGLVRQGGRHEIWRFGELKLSIPRHSDINEQTAKAILADVTEEASR
jgi:mRNA interferase HicA